MGFALRFGGFDGMKSWEVRDVCKVPGQPGSRFIIQHMGRRTTCRLGVLMTFS